MEEKKYSLKLLIPYLGSFVILLAIVRLIIYYKQFGIDIINYIEFGEIITTSFDAIFLFVTTALVTWIIHKMVDDIKEKSDYYFFLISWMIPFTATIQLWIRMLYPNLPLWQSWAFSFVNLFMCYRITRPIFKSITAAEVPFGDFMNLVKKIASSFLTYVLLLALLQYTFITSYRSSSKASIIFNDNSTNVIV